MWHLPYQHPYKEHHNLSINQKESDGYIQGMDYNIRNFYYQINSTKNGIYKLLNAGYSEKEFGAFSFYTPVYPNQFEKTKTTFASLNLNKKGSLGFNNNIYWRLHEDEFILFRDNPSLYQNFHKTYLSLSLPHILTILFYFL